MRDDTEFLRQVQEKLEQAEEELQQQQEALQSEYIALGKEWRRWDDLNPHGPECRAIEKQLRRLEDEIWALGDADAEERRALEEEIQSLRESESFLEEEIGELEEAIEDYPEDVEALEEDIQACEDEMADLDADIEDQQANIEEAEGEYEQSVAEANREYEENEADAQRQYEAAEAAAAESTSAADESKGDQSSGSTDNNPTGNNADFDGLSKAFEQAFQNALDGTLAPDAIDQALQDALDKALQEDQTNSGDSEQTGSTDASEDQRKADFMKMMTDAGWSAEDAEKKWAQSEANLDMARTIGEGFALGMAAYGLGALAKDIFQWASSAAADVGLGDLWQSLSKFFRGEGATTGEAAGADFAPGKLESHFADHMGEWPPGLTQTDYLQKARDLLASTPDGANILGYTRANGDVLRYNVATNEFAVARSDGTIRTLFRPQDGLSYWQRQVSP